MTRLSAVVVTQNEERNIGRCLGSLKFADEIVVVDAFSEDRTVEIARAFGACVVSRKWDGFAAQKQFAIGEAGGEWVLLVDSDEAVSGELAEEIRAVVATDDARPAGFRIRRSNYFLGEPMPFGPWGKDYTLRLFRKTRGAIDAKPVHEGVRVDGEVGTLEGPLFHYTHQTLSESFRRLDRYTTLEAVERAGRRPIRLFDVVVPPFGVFFRYYIIGRCWKAGTRGFLLSAITAMYRSVLYVKMYLLQREKRDHAVR